MTDLQHDPGNGDHLVVEPTKPNRRRRITALAVAGGVLVIGGGIGAASLAQADPTPTPTPTASSTPGQPGQGGPRGDHGPGGPGGFGHGPRGGGFLGADTKELAAKLGVTEAKLTEALQAIRDENKPSAPPSAPSSTSPSTPTTPPDPSAREAAFVKALAAKLGLSESKVQAAVDAIKAEHQADRAKALKTKLDAAVKAGTLTQAEADAVTKAVEKGVIHG